MPKTGKRAAGRGKTRAAGSHERVGPASAPAKRPTNLTLDPRAVARGARFGARHGTSLSQLVTGFLFSLPAGEEEGEREARTAALTPPVRRLYGVAAGGPSDRDAYRAHLVEKYRAR